MIDQVMVTIILIEVATMIEAFNVDLLDQAAQQKVFVFSGRRVIVVLVVHVVILMILPLEMHQFPNIVHVVDMTVMMPPINV